MVDHAESARDWLKSNQPATAQVHATLALVEQQRIANLIALAESGRTTVNGARAALAALYTGSAEEGSAHMRLHPSITKALGLGDSND